MSSKLRLILIVLFTVAFLVLAFDTYVAVAFFRLYCQGHGFLQTLADMAAGHC